MQTMEGACLSGAGNAMAEAEAREVRMLRRMILVEASMISVLLFNCRLKQFMLMKLDAGEA